MKHRHGHVSNSSTSSFCIIGFKIDEDEMSIEEKLKLLKFKKPKDKDVSELEIPKKVRVRGCDHEETDEEFCTKCGSVMWDSGEDEYEKNVEKIYDTFHDEIGYNDDKDMFDGCYNSEYGDLYIGYDIDSASEYNPEEIEKILNITREALGYDKDIKANVFSGTEYC